MLQHHSFHVTQGRGTCATWAITTACGVPMTNQGANEKSTKDTDGRSEAVGHSASLRSVFIVSSPHSQQLIGNFSSVLILSPHGDVSSSLKLTSSGFSIGVAKMDVSSCLCGRLAEATV